jgi:indole-3-glycerol phosphate synthase
MYKDEHKTNINFNQILEECKRNYVPFKKKIEIQRKPKDIMGALKNTREEGLNPIIAEVKYRSPTRQKRESERPEDVAKAMKKGGTSAISVLTESKFFSGSIEYLKAVKEVSGETPVLRKDFIFHMTQIPESYYWGADSILLISSYFQREELKTLIEASRNFGMEPLVEIHNLDDIKRATNAGAKLFAINNRHKDTLKIDLNRTAEFAPHIKGLKVSASGIETPSQLLKALKYTDAALIGSSIMSSQDITRKVREFVEA